jgi:methyl-accepting chemotaxis protein
MKWNVGTKIGAGFGFVLAIFVIVGTISYGYAVRQTQEAERVTHTHAVLTELALLLSSLQNAETGARGFVITGVDRYLLPHTTGAAEAQVHHKRLMELVGENSRQQAQVATLERLIAERLSLLEETIVARRDRDFAAAQEVILSDRGTQAMNEIRRIVQLMNQEADEELAERAATAQSASRNAQWTIVFGTLAALVISGIAGLVITRNIAIPLGTLTSAAERITVGELNATVNADDRVDEVGVLARAFQRMTQSLRAMANCAEKIAAGDLRGTVQPQSPNDILGVAFARMGDTLRKQIGSMVEGAAVLGTAASEIAASTVQLASGASQSAAAVSQTTTSVEEIRQTAQMSTQKAKAVADSAQKAVQVSQSGRRSTEEAAAGVSRIRSQMESIAESMMRLSEQGHTIGQIIASVEDLATQSNLLAVNAAIEAAKAGEHGKGFGVVAQEVKSLAEQSRQATDRVRAILGEIQKATTAAVMATEQGSKAVESGGKQTELANESIQALLGSVTEAAQAATQIAASSQQQLVGMDQVAGAMENIRQASTQNVASARQLENAARNLNDLGQRMKQLVEGYAV